MSSNLHGVEWVLEVMGFSGWSPQQKQAGSPALPTWFVHVVFLISSQGRKFAHTRLG